MITCSPSVSTQVSVVCGEPSGINVVRKQGLGLRKRSRNRSGSFMCVLRTTDPIPAGADGAPRRRRSASIEHDGLVSVDEDPIFEMQAHGAAEDDLLQITTLAHQVVDRVAMRDARDVLFDDRAFVEQGGGVVSGCADELHATLLRLMV